MGQTADPPDEPLPRRRPSDATLAAPAAPSGSAVWAYWPLFLVAVFYGAFLGLLSVGDASRVNALFIQALMAACCAVWVTRDARTRRRYPFFDFGTLVFFTCGLAVPVYLIWTRGWRGVLVLLLLMAVVTASAFAGAVLTEVARMIDLA